VETASYLGRTPEGATAAKGPVGYGHRHLRRLLNESIDCWRPVEAIKEGENRYRIVSVPSDATEEWQFTNGDVVECETRRLWDGDALVALRRVE